MEKNIYVKAHELLKAGQKIVIIRTIKRMGSAPRAVGSMCIVTHDGELVGTIGGGLMEHKALKKALQLFSTEKSLIYPFHLTQEEIAQDGMICGGDVELYLEPVFPENSSTMEIFKTLRDHVTQNREITLITLIAENTGAMERQSRVLLLNDNTVLGEIPGFNREDMVPEKIEGQTLVELDNGKNAVFIEKMDVDPCVVIFGAGHISTFLAPLAKLVGFRAVIIDDRPEFANSEKFPDADEIHALSFAQAFQQVKITKKSFIVIVTRGHMFDKTVLEFALNTDAAYIGMIGSSRKKIAIYRSLMEQGITKEALDCVHAPIGLDINAETPEEIAVSILAQLIQERAGKKTEKKLIL